MIRPLMHQNLLLIVLSSIYKTKKSFTSEELSIITSPYDNWILDREYLERKGLFLSSEYE